MWGNTCRITFDNYSFEEEEEDNDEVQAAKGESTNGRPFSYAGFPKFRKSESFISNSVGVDSAEGHLDFWHWREGERRMRTVEGEGREMSTLAGV